MEPSKAILIVDDDRNLASNLQDILEAEGYKVAVTGNGQQAISLCTQTQFAVALIDIKLPDITGLQLIEDLSAFCSDLEFVIITGYGTLETAMSAVGQKRIIAYQTKPLEIVSLISLVKQVSARKQAEENLKKSEGRYRLLAENAEDIIWTADLDLRITYLSPSGKRRLSYEGEPLIPDQVKAILGFKSFEALKKAFRKALAEASPDEDPFRGRAIELEVPVKDGRIWIETKINLLRDASGQPNGILGVSRDITERKKAREDLQRSKAFLMEAQRIAHLGNWEYDVSADRAVWSGEMYRIFEVDPRRFAATRDAFLELVHPADRKMVEEAERNALYQDQRYSIDFRIILPGGSERVIHSEAEVAHDRSGKPVRVIGTSLDITERKRAEEELRALSRRLVQMQEAERRHIACDLHDQIGQSLTALKLLLERIRQGSSGAWSEVQSLTNELMLRVRNMSLDLRPSMLDDLGLLPALLWHFDRYTAQTHLLVNFKHCGLDQRLPLEVSTAAYRIVQEALTNVARHAEVKEVNVRAWFNEDTLNIQIEDQGKGFDMDALAVGTSSGLSGMRERVLLLGGRFDIESRPGKGTTISTEIPLSSVSTLEGDKRDKHSISR